MVNQQLASELTLNYRSTFDYDPFPQLVEILEAIERTAENGYAQVFISVTAEDQVLAVLGSLGYTINNKERYIQISWQHQTQE
jgi:peptide subunit release factor RF-3